MNIDQAMGQLRPILSLIGSALIAVGVLKFFGVNINVLRDTWWEIAAAGYFMKSI